VGFNTNQFVIKIEDINQEIESIKRFNRLLFTANTYTPITEVTKKIKSNELKIGKIGKILYNKTII
jgi:hypothetical protein